MRREVLIRNSAKCRNCGDEIESKSRHHYVSCTCYRESQENIIRIMGHVDSYLAIQGRELDIPLNHAVECALFSVLGTGIHIDGGLDYCAGGGNFDHLEYTGDTKKEYLSEKEIRYRLFPFDEDVAKGLKITAKMGGHIVENPKVEGAHAFIALDALEYSTEVIRAARILAQGPIGNVNLDGGAIYE